MSAIAHQLRFRLKRVLHSTSARVAGGLAISAILLLLALRPIDTAELPRVMASVSFKWIGIALAFYSMELLLRAQRWSIILRPILRLPFLHVATTLLVGYAANNVLPAKLGELFRADFVARRYRISRFSAVGTIVIERLLDMTAVVACAALGMLLMLQDRLTFVSFLASATLFGGLLVALTCLAVFSMLSYSGRWFSGRFARVHDAIQAVAAGLHSFKSPQQILALTVLTALVWICSGAAMWAVLKAVGISAQGSIVLLLIGIAGLAAAVPSAPANLGTLQFAFITVLAAGHYDATAAFAAALLVQVFLLGSVTLAGAVFYAAWCLRRGTHSRDAPT